MGGWARPVALAWVWEGGQGLCSSCAPPPLAQPFVPPEAAVALASTVSASAALPARGACGQRTSAFVTTACAAAHIASAVPAAAGAAYVEPASACGATTVAGAASAVANTAVASRCRRLRLASVAAAAARATFAIAATVVSAAAAVCAAAARAVGRAAAAEPAAALAWCTYGQPTCRRRHRLCSARRRRCRRVQARLRLRRHHCRRCGLRRRRLGERHRLPLTTGHGLSFLRFWPPAVLKFLTPGCFLNFGLRLFRQYFGPAVFRASL